MDFNFSQLADQQFTSTAQNYLRPYNIYEVTLTKIEKTEIQGKKDPTAKYQAINLVFTGEDGTFDTNLFVPNRPEDFEHKENENTHKLQPSNWEKFYMTLLQIMEVLNPKGAETFKKLAKEGKIKNTDTFIEVVLKALSNKTFDKVFLKLVGRNNDGKVYATLPTSCWYDMSENRVKPLNFINSDKTKLNFSAYELQQSKKLEEAKPTPMPESNDDSSSLLDDLDMDEL